jgi:hypothetical protein
LLAALEDEWAPSGPTETELVAHIASLMWRKRRQEVYEQSKLQKSIKRVQVSNTVNHIRRELRSLAPRLAAATTFKQVEDIITSHEFTVDYIAGNVPRPPADQEAKWGPSIAEYLEKKMEIGKQLDGIDAFVEFVDPNEIELEVIRSNRLQEEIDRTIKRLVQVKTCKQLLSNTGGHPAKLIDVSPTKAIKGAKASESANDPGLPGEVAKVAERTWRESLSTPIDLSRVQLRIT